MKPFGWKLLVEHQTSGLVSVGQDRFLHIHSSNCSNFLELEFLSPLQELLVYGPVPECPRSRGLRPKRLTRGDGLDLLHQHFPHALALLPHSQAILNNDETSFKLDNLDADTEYDVKVTAIYPDEAESEDLLASTRTCKFAMRGSQILHDVNALKIPRQNH